MTFKEMQKQLGNGKKFKYNKWSDGTEYIFLENNKIRLYNPYFGVMYLDNDIQYLYEIRNDDAWEEYIEKPKNNFKDYGLKCKNKEFQGEIKFKSKDTCIGEINGLIYLWLKNGECYNIKSYENNVRVPKFDLIPIKNEWYEYNNFPCNDYEDAYKKRIRQGYKYRVATKKKS